MDIKRLVDSLRDCPCGRPHKAEIKAIEIGSGLKAETAKILNKYGFPKRILVVADKNTLRASDGIMEILKEGGFDAELELYDNLRVAEMTECRRLQEICGSRGFEGILSVGSGSLNDICRFAALHADTDFAIFATAPSMDGFASGTAPITDNNFKTTHPATAFDYNSRHINSRKISGDTQIRRLRGYDRQTHRSCRLEGISSSDR